MLVSVGQASDSLVSYRCSCATLIVNKRKINRPHLTRTTRHLLTDKFVCKIVKAVVSWTMLNEKWLLNGLWVYVCMWNNMSGLAHTLCSLALLIINVWIHSVPWIWLVIPVFNLGRRAVYATQHGPISRLKKNPSSNTVVAGTTKSVTICALLTATTHCHQLHSWLR